MEEYLLPIRRGNGTALKSPIRRATVTAFFFSLLFYFTSNIEALKKDELKPSLDEADGVINTMMAKSTTQGGIKRLRYREATSSNKKELASSDPIVSDSLLQRSGTKFFAKKSGKARLPRSKAEQVIQNEIKASESDDLTFIDDEPIPVESKETSNLQVGAKMKEKSIGAMLGATIGSTLMGGVNQQLMGPFAPPTPPPQQIAGINPGEAVHDNSVPVVGICLGVIGGLILLCLVGGILYATMKKKKR